MRDKRYWARVHLPLLHEQYVMYYLEMKLRRRY